MKLRILLPIVIVSLITAHPAAAQMTAPDMPQRPGIEEADIRPFAAALQEVQRITDSYSPFAAAARTPQELDRVESAAFDEMKDAVAKKGFVVSRFNEIVAMAQLDPDLADRIRAHLP